MGRPPASTLHPPPSTATNRHPARCVLVVQERRAGSLEPSLCHLLPFSAMKFTTDYPVLARILLKISALSLLLSVEAEFAKCLEGWEWV